MDVDTTEWIGVDLDGTLIEDTGWKGADHFGRIIQPMLDRVNRWLDQGRKVKIMTARANPLVDEEDESYADRMFYLNKWMMETFGERANEIEITYEKDLFMIELWDDRCVQVELNTGRRVDSIRARNRRKQDGVRPDCPGFWRAKEKPYKGNTAYRMVRIVQCGDQLCADSFVPLEVIEKRKWFNGWAGMVSPLYDSE
jgi:hypothetical protein